MTLWGDTGWTVGIVLFVLRLGHGQSPSMIQLGTSWMSNDSFEDESWHAHDAEIEGQLEKLLKSGKDNTVYSQGKDSLHIAAYFGHLELAMRLIQQDANLNARDDDGLTPLHAAVTGGRRKMARYLLASGADINSQDGTASTPLHLAVSIRFPRLVRELLESPDINLNLFNRDMMAPLHMAVAAGMVNTTALLVDRGAQLNLPSGRNGMTAFHLAVNNRNSDIVNILAKKGANINAQTFDGHTSLHLAVDRDDEVMTKTLLSLEGIALQLKTDKGQNPLQLAETFKYQSIIALLNKRQADYNSRLLDAANFGNDNDVKSLIDVGANLETRKDPNGTALHVAASKGHLHVVRVLLDAGVNVDTRDSNGTTAVFAAVTGGHLSVVEYLAREGANLNARDDTGMTVLHKASQEGNADIVRYLVQLKCNVNARDDRGWTPLHYSISEQSIDAFREIMKSSKYKNDSVDTKNIHNLDMESYTSELMTPLHMAVTAGQLVIVKELTEKGAQLERRGDDGLTAFHYATLSSNLEMMTLLSQQGADVNAKTSNGSTPLHMAVAQGNIEKVIRLLGMKRIRLDVENGEGQTPLQLARQLGYDDIAGRILVSVTDRNSRMIRAADNGELDVVKSLVRDGADINCSDPYEETALHKAVRNGHIEVVKYLLQKGADMHAQQHSGFTPLSQAADQGNLEMVKLMVTDYKADVRSKDITGMALLHWAAHGGNTDMAKFLVESGAKVDEVDDDGETPLHKAAWMGYMDMVKYLCDSNATVDAQRVNGETPLHWAACNGYTSIARYLANAKPASMSITNIHGETPLDCAVRHRLKDTAVALQECVFFKASGEGNINIVESVVNSGIDLAASDDLGNTALHKAAANGELDVVGYLTRMGANISATNNDGDTPLVIAAVHGQAKVVSWILDNIYHNSSGWDQKSQREKALFRTADSNYSGCDKVLAELIYNGVSVLSTDNNGMNVVHWAAHGGNSEVMESLLGSLLSAENLNNAVSNAKDASGENPLQVAARMGNLEAVMDLVDHSDLESLDNEGKTALHKAAERNIVDVVRYLLMMGADVNRADIFGNTPLHLAAGHGCLGVTALLLQRGADMTARLNDGHRKTPLFHAANSGRLNVVEYMIDFGGASVNATDDGDMTLLHWAAHGGNASLVQYLLDKGVPINSKDISGETPLHKAAWKGNIEAVKCLVENGADVNARRIEGETPLHWAALKNYLDIAKFLIENGADKTITTNLTRETPKMYALRKGNTDLAMDL